MALTLRKDKGSKLSIKELDDNFTYLDSKLGSPSYKVYSGIIKQRIVIPSEEEQEPQNTPIIIKTDEKFVIGRTYLISKYVKGDDFTNIGASENSSNIYFIATGELPNVWRKSTITYDSSPIIDELENTLDTNLYWLYKSTGRYILNSYTPIFFENKTPTLNYLNIDGNIKTINLQRISDTEVLVSQTILLESLKYSDDIESAFIELRVYNGGTASLK